MKNLLIALGGAALGGIAGFLVAKHQYTARMEEEIQSIKESYESRLNHLELKYDKQVDSLKEEKSKYEDIVNGYATDTADKVKEVGEVNKLEVISPITREEYEDDETSGEVDIVSWTYYADGVLADERNDVVDQAQMDETVGSEFYKLFESDKYCEDDIIYIRNTKLAIDYEILKTGENYSDNNY